MAQDGTGRRMDRRSARFGVLAAFLLLTVGGGLLIGYATRPGDWYQSLAKPWFNPPGWVFGPVWTLLYVLIGVAGWRIWRAASAESGARVTLRLWALQLLFNFAWSPAFFGANRIGLALAVILALLVVILAFIASSWRRDRLAAWLFVPYAAWVGFASALNLAILKLNGA